jgi:biotin-[acetyl-CoA-carboxylase] ligase BirA-like protein
MNPKASDILKRWTLENNIDHIHFEKTESTNTYAKNHKLSGRPLIISADHQTRGRGRSEKIWQDENSGQLLSSWCFESKSLPQPVFSILIGLCLYEAARSAWPVASFSLKAPNDLLLNGKKVAGLLIEIVSQKTTHIIVGLGMNVWHSPAGIDQAITSLTDNLTIDNERMSLFLSRFFTKLSQLIELDQKQLSVNDANNILFALNQNPHLQQPYLKMDSSGTLFTNHQTIHWRDL